MTDNRENQPLSTALTSFPKCGEGPKSSPVLSEAPGARSWDPNVQLGAEGRTGGIRSPVLSGEGTHTPRALRVAP